MFPHHRSSNQLHRRRGVNGGSGNRGGPNLIVMGCIFITIFMFYLFTSTKAVVDSTQNSITTSVGKHSIQNQLGKAGPGAGAAGLRGVNKPAEFQKSEAPVLTVLNKEAEVEKLFENHEHHKELHELNNQLKNETDILRNKLEEAEMKIRLMEHHQDHIQNDIHASANNNAQEEEVEKEEQKEKQQEEPIKVESDIEQRLKEAEEKIKNMMTNLANNNPEINKNAGDVVVDTSSSPQKFATFPDDEVHPNIQLPFDILSSNNNENQHFSISAWVYLTVPEERQESRTLLTNKGITRDDLDCDENFLNENGKGFSLYINHEGTEDQSLIFDYFTLIPREDVEEEHIMACKKQSIDSEGVIIPLMEWTHIGLTVEHNQETKLFINGIKVSEDIFDTQETEDIPTRTNKGEPSMMNVGETKGDRGYPLYGQISMLSLWIGGIIDEEQMKMVYESGMNSMHIMKLGLTGKQPGALNYLYPFENDSILTEYIQTKDARYYKEPPVTSSLSSTTAAGEENSAKKTSDSTAIITAASMIHPDWKPLGKGRYSDYKDGSNIFTPTPEILEQSDNLARARREQVKNGMKHAWSGYKKYAWGKDELIPISKRSRDNWGGMGTTLVDALDTLWLMDLKNEFWEARDWVRDSLSHDHVPSYVSVFETTIRSLGGLLSAYDLSGDHVFLDKAEDLGKRLFKAFDSPSGIPYAQVNLRTGQTSKGWAGNNALIAEAGTLQIEFRYLAKATGKQEYATKAEKVFELLEPLQREDGLYPYMISNTHKDVSFGNNVVTFGAMGDSFYEYMLKIWLQGGKTEPMYRTMYDKSVDGLHKKLIQKTSKSGLTYIADLKGSRLEHKMDHLACFMAGSLALGAYTDPFGLESERAQRDLQTGKALAYTCYQMYAQTKTGIAGENVKFTDGQMHTGTSYYILRPETVESFFILNKLTGDPTYREWGWEIFQALERFCKTSVAYGGRKNVENPSESPEDKMESFFLAETMKYLYLLFDPDTEIDILSRNVFNTEAHPLGMFY